MGPVEIGSTQLKVVQERPAQRAARDCNGRCNSEISDSARSVHGSVVRSIFSQIEHETWHIPENALAGSCGRALRSGHVDLCQPRADPLPES